MEASISQFNTVLTNKGLLYVYRFIWLIALAAHTFALIFYSSEYIQFIANTLSSDGQLHAPGTTVARLSFLLVLVGFVPTILNISLNRLQREDGRALFVFMYVVLGAYLVARMIVFTGHPPEDGFLEYAQAAMMFIAGCLIIFAASANAKQSTPDTGALGLWLYYLIGIFLILVAMEEISWGQRIFGWETPDDLAAINYQQETNFHNLFNPYIAPIWFVAFLGVLLIVNFAENIAKTLNKWLHLSDVHPVNMLQEIKQFLRPEFVLILLILIGEGELAEEIFAIANLFFAIGLMMLLSKKSGIDHGRSDNNKVASNTGTAT